MRSNPITKYWLQYYLNKDLCSLCGSKGIINTVILHNALGERIDRKNWCICPNGQSIRKQVKGKLPK